MAIPRFYQFLHNKNKFSITDKKILQLYKEIHTFCRKNPNIIFTRAGKGSTTVALNKEVFKKNGETSE